MAKAPKKDKFHSEAPGEVYELLEEVIEEHHSNLDDIRFKVMMRHGGWKSKNKTIFGKVTVLADAYRRVMQKEAMLILNADMWASMSKPQREYVLDHQLYSIDVAEDKHGDTKMALDGFPVLTSVPPDIEAYANVIKRHGVIMEDVKRLASALKETNQLTIEDVVVENGEPPVEPREGVRGTINPDGTAEVEDKNQLKLPFGDPEPDADPMSGVGEADTEDTEEF